MFCNEFCLQFSFLTKIAKACMDFNFLKASPVVNLFGFHAVLKIISLIENSLLE